MEEKLKEVYKCQEWDLSELNKQNIKDYFKSIEQLANKIESYKDNLNEDTTIGQINEILQKKEELKIQISTLLSYHNLKTYENSTDQDSNTKLSQICDYLSDISNRLLFFNFWFKGIKEEKANELISQSTKYKYLLQSIRKNIPYTLSEEEEKLINIKDNNGTEAVFQIYEILTSQFTYDWNGEEINQSQLLKYVKSSKREERKKAYTLLMEKYKNYKDVIAEVYKNRVLDWHNENIKLRGHKNPISVRNNINDVPDQVVEVLLKVIKKNSILFQKYFKIKQKLLGLKNFDRFDIYTPLKTDEDKYEYDSAIQMILSAFEKFDIKFKQNALKIIESNHIHAPIIKNKRGGAFCYSPSTKIIPYVLTNFSGNIRDVSTIAHELGHGIHSLLANDKGEFGFHATLPLAETASIFSEMLLLDYLVEKYPEKRTELIVNLMDDSFGSILRQYDFVNFEIKAHDMIKDGKTYDEISEEYLNDLKSQYKIKIDDNFKYEWMYVNHIFDRPFYVYAYAFGKLLTLALYELYLENKDKFKPKII
ncbi:hypothetical protein HOK68_03375, partial [Candidatus Woesearchaeota archaeon]|nr:hypothetical protein [Candidatus Woesearchaeota archaeon]